MYLIILQRGGGRFIYDVHSSMFTLLSGAAGDPGHGTKIARGWDGTKVISYCLLGLFSEFRNNEAWHHEMSWHQRLQ